MKLNKKITAIAASLVFAGTAAFAFDASAFNTDKISDGLSDFAEQLSVAVPQAATQQNVWADAWIGSLLPGLRLGGGLNFAITNINTEGLASAAKALEIGGVEDSYKFPVFTADLRVGGFILPFDADIAVMKTGTLTYPEAMTGSEMSADIFTIGFDVRYALLEGGLLMPKVSAGLGYFYNQGTFGISNKNAEAEIEYKIHTMYLSAQVSKELSIPVVRIGITPFIGGRLFVSDADNDWSWKFKNSEIQNALALLSKPSEGSGNVSKSIDYNNFQPQLYGGIGFNFALLQLTVSASIDPKTFSEDKTWSGAVSLRIRH
jgi:hypothetical protein